jgi:ubiquinone/menaquinone biosynthesis C-methylase UbiE
MGHQAADWLERPEREQEEKTSLLIEALKFKPGEMVADIGAGTGYLTRRIAPRILPRGKVFAVEIQREMLDALTNRLKGEGITNVVPVLGTVTDPKLPSAALDTIIMVDVYHEFDFPFEMTETMCRALKPGGRLVFVEFRAEDESVPIKRVHKMSEAQVKKEMAPHPLVWKETISVLPWQHIIVFARK